MIPCSGASIKTAWPPIAGDDGILTVDSSEFPKGGEHSVGVARQYCGHLGKRENCQSGVFVGYASDKDYGLLATQLYMPQKWFDPDHDERRQECAVPEDLTFQTKPRIAQELLENVRAGGRFPARWLACDATFGADLALRDGVAAHYWYLAQIRSDTLVWTDPPSLAVPLYRGPGPRPTKARPTTSPRAVSEVAGSWFSVSQEL